MKQRVVRFLQVYVSLFILLAVIFIPFHFYLFPFQQDLTEFLFGGMMKALARHFFAITLNDAKVYSDSSTMYLLLLILSAIALLATVLLAAQKKLPDRISLVAVTVSCYYLSVVLLKYGLDKLFKKQFYLPEPNILYTPLGYIDKDILYWSTIGTSYAYSVITGLAEIIAALLLLFQRTRKAGIFLTGFIILHIVAINFCFDISVKLFSLFLLLIISFLFIRQRFFPGSFSFLNWECRSFYAAWINTLILGAGLVESFFPMFKDGNFNDDKAPRPYLHGAYQVEWMLAGRDTFYYNQSPVRRFFIHRDGFFIFQDQQNAMKDYQLTYGRGNHLLLTGYDHSKQLISYHYSLPDSVLQIQYQVNGTMHQLRGRQLDWRNIPLLKKSFHWTSDKGW